MVLPGPPGLPPPAHTDRHPALTGPLLSPQVGRTFDPTTAFVVEDLKPDTEYAFRLAARSPQGLGAFTSAVRQRTLQSSTCPLAVHLSQGVGGRLWPARPRPCPALVWFGLV